MHHTAHPPVQCAHTYKHCPDMYIADWLPHHIHTENRDQEIADICIHAINTALDVPICTLIEDIRAAVSKDIELQMLQANIIGQWPQNKDELRHSLGGCWPIRHDLAIASGVVIKGKQTITAFALQKQIWEQLYSNKMEIEKTWLF